MKIAAFLLIGLATLPTCGQATGTTDAGSAWRIAGASKGTIPAIMNARHAACLVKKNASKGRQLLAATSEPQFGSLLLSFDPGPTCSDTLFSGNQPNQSVVERREVYRGNVAEALIENTALASVPALPLATPYSSPWNAVSRRDPSLDELATCVAATAPAGIFVLIRTVPGGDAETEAMDGLAQAIGPCVPANDRLTGDRLSMRAALAEALYQRIAEDGSRAASAEKK